MSRLNALLAETTDPHDRWRIHNRIRWVQRRRSHARNERDRAIREAHFAQLKNAQAAAQ
ncbi:hypothetical protein [Microbacterium azadirachtae]|nr:hypothetical protein [Microbacterium azadirachtae]